MTSSRLMMSATSSARVYWFATAATAAPSAGVILPLQTAFNVAAITSAASSASEPEGDWSISISRSFGMILPRKNLSICGSPSIARSYPRRMRPFCSSSDRISAIRFLRFFAPGGRPGFPGSNGWPRGRLVGPSVIVRSPASRWHRVNDQIFLGVPIGVNTLAPIFLGNTRSQNCSQAAGQWHDGTVGE